MAGRSLFLLVGGSLMMAFMQIGIHYPIPDFASGLLGGVGIGLLILCLILRRRHGTVGSR